MARACRRTNTPRCWTRSLSSGSGWGSWCSCRRAPSRALPGLPCRPQSSGPLWRKRCRPASLPGRHQSPALAPGTARRSCCWAPTAGRRTRNTACCSAWMPPGACSPPATSPSAGAWAAWTPRARRWWTSSPASATTHCHSSPAQAPPRCLPASGTRMPWRRCASTWIPTASRRAARCGRATAGRWRPRAWRTACCWGCCPRALAAGPLPWLPSRARAAGCTCTKT
mmetsp:Transcript_13993/g.35256  ORF Transcript_13993/g.35256 Transcript_13993/m.35256 type:complete len:226 (+) Transcript_13993:140-817(+)